jgi:hypothetical protein
LFYTFGFRFWWEEKYDKDCRSEFAEAFKKIKEAEHRTHNKAEALARNLAMETDT